MYRKNYKRNDKDTRSMTRNYEDRRYTDQNPQDFGRGRPVKEAGNAGERLGYRMIRDLPLSSSSINLKADPYSESRGVEGPYKYYNRNNKILNPKYSGEYNIDGASAMQMYDQPNSSFLNYFDMVSLKLRPNYRMMSLRKRVNGDNVDVTNYGLVTEMFKTFCERMGQVDASTYTEMVAFNYAVETSMVVSQNLSTDEAWSPFVVNVAGHTYFTGFAAVFLAMLEYQQILQRLANAFCSVNKERSYRSHQKTMGWTRENTFLERLWGRFNSKSWLANWLALATNVEGEYFDVEWMQTINTLSMLMSRKSNAIIDPLCELRVITDLPDMFKMYASISVNDSGEVTLGPIIFDYSLMSRTSNVEITKPYGTGVISQNAPLSFAGASETLVNWMSPITTQTWARITLTRQGGNLQTVNVCTPQQYGNTITNCLDVIDTSFGYFKTAFRAIRKVIEIAVRVGINNWEHVRLGILQKTDVEVLYNTTITDLLSAYLTGGTDISVDERTSRWTGYTIFNKYYGIPDYDYINGGCFITFSLKNLVPGNFLLNTRRIPFLFAYPAINGGSDDYDFLNITCYAVNRYGECITIGYTTIDNMSKSKVLARMNPIEPMDNIVMRIPANQRRYVLDSSTPARGTGSWASISCFYHLLENLFHFGVVQTVENSNQVDDYIMSSDIMSFTDFEVNDVTNVMIAYARSYGPIKTNSSSTIIGFQLK